MLKSKSTKWLTTAYVVGWLEEKQVVELLFGKGVHFELISRSKDILRVLSEFRRYSSAAVSCCSGVALSARLSHCVWSPLGTRFGEEHINLMWSAAVGKGKQERITDTIYDLFDHLTKDLEPELVAFLVQKIRDTRVFDVKTLNLMKTLTLHQLLEDEDEVPHPPISPRPSAPVGVRHFSHSLTRTCSRHAGALHWRTAALLGHHPG
jgi:hypothetical protein